MSLVTININADLGPVIARLDEVISIVTGTQTKVDIMANDLTVLKGKLDELEAKAAETNDTLAGLAQAVVDLKASGDVQAGIDALVVQAQGILDGLAAAEDAADDQLPTA